MTTVFINGKIFTPGIGFSDSFAVKDDRFVSPGEAPCQDRIIDLKGAFVCPGFIDTHMHLIDYGQAISACMLDEHTGSIHEVLAYMRAFLQRDPLGEGEWLFARGWNDDFFCDEKRYLNQHDLDQVSTDVPIYAERTCGHCACVNTKALEVMGITADTPAPDGGRIDVENGELTGLVFDNAIDLIRRAMPEPSIDLIKAHIKAACKSLGSYGVTSCMTDDFTAMYRWPDVVRAYRELEAEGELTVRIYQQCYFDKPEELKTFLAAGYTTGTGTDMYRIGPMKMIADGAVGAHTAFLSEPYSDMPETCGAPVYSQAVLDEMIGLANRNDMQIAIHAIGDRCLDMVLDAYEKAFSEHKREDHRDTLIHCLVTRPDQLPRIKRLGLRVHFQSAFLDYHCRIAEQRLGKERAEHAYAWKSMQDMGIGVSNSSDAPVEIPSPLRGIQLAVTRRPVDGSMKALNPREAFSLEEAFAGYTTNAAPASFDEYKKGRIEPGYLADFIILSDDPFRTDPDSLSAIRVLETWVNGRRVENERPVSPKR